MRLLLVILFFSGISWADYQVWKVSRLGKKIIIKLDNNEFIQEGDRLYLQNDHGKCWTKVIKVKGIYGLISSESCQFSLEKGDRLVHRDYFLGAMVQGRDNEAFSVDEDEEKKERREDKKFERKFERRSERGRNREALKRYNQMMRTIFSLQYSFLDNFHYELIYADDSSQKSLSEKGTVKSGLGVGVGLIVRNPRWKSFGMLGKLGYQFNRKINLVLGESSPFSSLRGEGNLCYFINRSLFIYGGANYNFPLGVKKFDGANTTDFQTLGGLSFQVGGAYMLQDNVLFSLSYQRDRFFSTQNVSDGQDTTEEGVGVYNFGGVIFSIAVSLF